MGKRYVHMWHVTLCVGVCVCVCVRVCVCVCAGVYVSLFVCFCLFLFFSPSLSLAFSLSPFLFEIETLFPFVQDNLSSIGNVGHLSPTIRG